MKFCRAFSSFAENAKRTSLLEVQVVHAFTLLRGAAWKTSDPLVSSACSLEKDESRVMLERGLGFSDLAREFDDNGVGRARRSYGDGGDTEKLRDVLARVPYPGSTLSMWSKITWANIR